MRARMTVFVAVAGAIAFAPRGVDAHPTLRVGGEAGVTVGPSEYFPTFLAGLSAEFDLARISIITFGAVSRLQLYSHREEEDYGSWGGQQDLSLALRLSMFDERAEQRAVIGFVVLRVGGAVVERVPRRDSDSAELIGGYLVGGSIGIAFRWREGQPRLHLQLSYDRPSFTTDDDKVGPVGELSVAFMTRVW